MRQKIYTLCCILMATMSMVHGQEIQKTNWITNGPVVAVTQNSTNVYMGGYFNLVGRQMDNGVLYNSTTGDPIVNGNYPDGSVSSSAPDGQGGFFIAGTYSNWNHLPSFSRVGTQIRDGLAHILPDGEVSSIFNPVLSAGKSGKVILAATTDRVIVGVRGTQEMKIYCLAFDGSIQWERNISGGEAHSAVIHAGTIYVVGRFTAIEGQSRQRAAAFDVATGNLLAWNTGTRIPAINSLVRQSIWIGLSGEEVFIRYLAPITFGAQHLFTADRLTGALTGWGLPNINGGPMVVHNGRVYYSWGNTLYIMDAATKNPLPVPSTVAYNSAISALSAEGENIFVASSNAFNDTNGNPIGSVFGFNENTLAVQTMNTHLYRSIDSYQTSFIATLAAGNGQLYVGGRFPSIGMRRVTNLFGYNRQSGEWIDFAPTLDGDIQDLEAFENKLYVNGYFTEANGQPRANLACFDLTTNQLTPWHIDAFVNDFARWNNRLYVAGENPGMRVYDGDTEQPIAWTPEGPAISAACTADDNGVYTAGSPGIHFLDHNTGNALHPPVTLSAYIAGMVATNNRLFMVGEFYVLGSGAPAVDDRSFRVIDLNTGLSMESDITIAPDWAFPEAITADQGSVYIGGQFERVNGLTRNKTAAINAETLQPTDWTIPIESDFDNWGYPVSSISAFDDGIYISGHFGRAKNISVKNMAIASPDRSNVVSGTVFLDNNGNGTQDAGEQGVPNILVEIQPGDLYYPTDANGHYTLYTGVGDYSIQPVHPTYALSVNPESINLSFADDLMASHTNNFAVVPYPSLTDDAIEVVSDRTPRPGFEYEYTVSYHNAGTVNSSGTVEVVLDPRLTIESTVPLPSSSVGNILQWTYTDAIPGERNAITINARVPAPTINGSLLGEHIVTTATITPSVADNDETNNIASVDEVVVGSVDPNDKLVTPQGYGPNGYIDEDTDHLTYTIRFQNVGTAPAENIYLEDLLDINLDVSSFSVVESSHPGFSYYIENRTLHVSYLNINLEDSVANEPASHGFFTFSIGLNDGLTRGTVIQNAASIIFDYNLPLATNIVTNTLRNPPYPVIVFAGQTEASIGESISLPIMVNRFENILGGQFSVSWDPAVITFEDVEDFNLPGLNINSFGLDHTDDGYLSFAWNDPTIQLQTLSDSTAIFNIRFTISGNPGDESPVSITQFPTTLEFIGEDYAVVESERADGSVSVDNTIEVAGHVLYPNGEAVQNVTIDVSGSGVATTTTDANGSYEITLEPLDDQAVYTLTPVKADDPDLLNGIDVQDVASIRRHILQTELLTSPYSIIAADVSNNQNISIQDVLILQAVILGVETNYPNERQWAFVADAIEFEAQSSPFPYTQSVTPSLGDLASEPQDFTAVKMGDINLSRDNAQSGRRNTQEVVFEIGHPVETENGNVEVDIKTFGFIDIAAYQFTIQWNPAQLRFVETVTNEITSQFGSHRVQDGLLTTLWDDPNGTSQSLSESSSLMKIRFEKIGQDNVDNVSIVGNITPVKMYDENLREVNLTLREGQEERIESGFFYPNPFTTKTKVSFSANESQIAVFEVIDVMGKRLDAQEVPIQKGWNEISYNGSTLQEGVYVFKLLLKDKRINAKIIKRNE
jgi:uncharacterized repeat protein (TIGR01451 family)